MFQEISLKERISFVLQAALCCFLWGTAIPSLKISYGLLNIPSEDIFNRLVLAGMRFMLAGVLIGIFIYIREKRVPLVKGHLWKKILIFGLFNTVLQYLFFYIGVGNTGAIKGVLIDTSKPLIVVLMAHFFTKDDKIDLYKIMGLIIGFVGIIIINLDAAMKDGINFSMTWIGEGTLFMASIVYGVAVIYGRQVMKEVSSLVLNMYQFLMGASILLIIGLIGAKGFHLEFNRLALILLVYSSFLSAVAFVVWYKLIDKYSPSAVSVFAFLVPVFGSIISSIVFVEETLTFHVVVSLLFMSISIYLVNHPKKKTSQKRAKN